MTAQFSERLYYEGNEHSMCSEPLYAYLSITDTRPKFRVDCTACWRGYLGTWLIENDQLYLVDISGYLEDGSEANLQSVFPLAKERVFAEWFSGTLRIPQGKILNYVHGGYLSTYEQDLFLEIERGRLVNKVVVKNQKPEPAEWDEFDLPSFMRKK